VILQALLPIVSTVVDRIIPDKTKAAELQQELSLALIAHEARLVEAAASVVRTEAASQHWVTAAWRPITMLIFAAIVANNFILAPYLGWIFGKSLQLTIPDDLWDLLKIGLGGYVVGRSAEKIVKDFAARR
jgi:hypothetical protein